MSIDKQDPWHDEWRALCDLARTARLEGLGTSMSAQLRGYGCAVTAAAFELAPDSAEKRKSVKLHYENALVWIVVDLAAQASRHEGTFEICRSSWEACQLGDTGRLPLVRYVGHALSRIDGGHVSDRALLVWAVCRELGMSLRDGLKMAATWTDEWKANVEACEAGQDG